MKKKIKQMIIRWAVKQLHYLSTDRGGLTYESLEKYGVEDIIVNEHTKEKMFILVK